MFGRLDGDRLLHTLQFRTLRSVLCSDLLLSSQHRL